MSARQKWELGTTPIDLIEPLAIPESGFWFETLAGGFSLGEPEGTEKVLATLLLDGDDVRIDRWTTRSVTTTVYACGYTTDDLSSAERALWLEIGTSNRLLWTPPDEIGAPTLFWVRTSKMRLVTGGDEDLDWIRPGVKRSRYELTFVCAPWGYGANLITETFTPGTATLTSRDNCSSATNWPGFTTTTYLSKSCIAGTVFAADNGTHTQDFARTGTIAAGNFLMIEAIVKTGQMDDLRLYGTGYPGDGATPKAVVPLDDGFAQYYFTWFGTAHDLVGRATMQGSDSTVQLLINQISTSNTIPSTSVLSLNMSGSVRNYASLEITATDPLENLFVAADPTYASHGWYPSNPDTWRYAPDGTYMLWIEIEGDDTYHDYAAIIPRSSLDTESPTKRTRVVVGNTVTEWWPIGPFVLGGYADQVLHLDPDWISVTDPADPGWSPNAMMLFREGDAGECSMTYIAGMDDEEYVSIVAPSIDNPKPGIYALDPNDALVMAVRARHIRSRGWPILQPPRPVLFVYSTNNAAVAVTATHRPAFHTLASWSAS